MKSSKNLGPKAGGFPNIWSVVFSPTLSTLLGSLGQIGELLFGLREYHPTIRLGPWGGGGRCPTQDASTQEVTEPVKGAFILRRNSNLTPYLVTVLPST